MKGKKNLFRYKTEEVFIILVGSDLMLPETPE